MHRAHTGYLGIVVCLLATGCSYLAERQRSVGGARYTLRVAGGHLPRELIRSWAQRCPAAHFEVTKGDPLVSAPRAFDALREGRIDLACTSWRIARYELERFDRQQVARPLGWRVAVRAFALYVHPSNPIRSLTANQVKQIYRREATQWSSLGWADGGSINLYGPPRRSAGGELLMGIAKSFIGRPPWESFDQPQAVLAAVADDPDGLGFAPLGLDGAVRTLALASYKDDPPVEATDESVMANKYLLGKLVYVWSANPPAEPVKVFMDWLFSEAGAAEIRRSGYTPIAPDVGGVDLTHRAQTEHMEP
ncbi:MAG TPA: substrate-binding domain-containing protein [Phycisphaerae bacterium]|nr:substrate-binding domain-containing protein [Phycisphaerae bacterium]